ncbi:MAG: hypothetical protein P1P69_09410 [Methanosarcinaceae archaeon]|nr:hypothetical protein [Methanosarcinaceae archaeon]
MGSVCTITEEIIKTIDEALKDETEPGISLVLTTAKKYNEANVTLTEYMVNTKGIPGVYVTLNKPYRTMIKNLDGKVDLRMLIFIDAITKSTGGKINKEDECLYLDTMQNLTDLGVAIDQAIRAIPNDEKFLLFDSLSTLLIYSQVGSVSKFIHFLTGKIRALGVNGILLSLVHGEEDEFLSQLSMFCDQTIYLDE